jgi:DNA-binding MarR family transcriptional regulator
VACSGRVPGQSRGTVAQQPHRFAAYVPRRSGPLSPTALARLTGVHPGTLTGILDRLERGGWIARERAENDRRAVLIRALGDRQGELYGMLAGMNRSIEEICAGYSDAELAVVADFLRRTTEAGETAVRDLP